MVITHCIKATTVKGCYELYRLYWTPVDTSVAPPNYKFVGRRFVALGQRDFICRMYNQLESTKWEGER